jgi:hypothetical protein
MADSQDRKWQPDPFDPAALAAFRWYVNELENLASMLYITDRNTYDEILTILKVARVALKSVKKNKLMSQQCDSSADCPRGYQCVDGQCEPDTAKA